MNIRKNRMRDDKLWDELKYWLANPVTEEEQNMRDREEQRYINTVLDKAFSDNKNMPAKRKEPYLTYEDLLGKDDEDMGTPTGMAAPVNKNNSKYSSLSDPFAEIDAKSGWTEAQKAAKKAEVEKILETSKAREREINRDNAIAHVKNWGGAALQIGSAAIPVAGAGGLAAKGAVYLGKKLAPKLGRKIAEEVSRGVAAGTLSGAVEGVGRGLMEDENILKTAAQDAAAGALFGAGSGAAGGKISNIKRKNNLEELLDKHKDWGIAFRKQSGKPKEAIDKLLEQKQGFVPKAVHKSGVGDIDFVWGKGKKNGYGLSHIIDQRNADGLDGTQFVKQVPDIILNGKIEKIPTQPNIDFIRDGEQQALVKKVWDNKKRKWIVTAFKEKESLNKPINRTPDIANNKSEMTPSLDLNKDDIIITDIAPNLNPVTEKSAPRLSTWTEWLEKIKEDRMKKRKS